MRKAIARFGIFCLTAVLALTGRATAGTHGKITGKVLDDQGRPLPGANSDYIKYGDMNDRDFYGSPRRVEVGLRASF